MEFAFFAAERARDMNADLRHICRAFSNFNRQIWAVDDLRAFVHANKFRWLVPWLAKPAACPARSAWRTWMTLLKPSVFHRDKDYAQNVKRCGAMSSAKRQEVSFANDRVAGFVLGGFVVLYPLRVRDTGTRGKHALGWPSRAVGTGAHHGTDRQKTSSRVFAEYVL